MHRDTEGVTEWGLVSNKGHRIERRWVERKGEWGDIRNL